MNGHTLGGAEDILSSAAAASAATDDADLDHIAAGRVNGRKTQLRGHSGACRHRRRFQEIAPGGAVGASARFAHITHLLVPWDRSSRGRTTPHARGTRSHKRFNALLIRTL